MRVINEFQAYIESDLMRLVDELQQPAPRFSEPALTRAMHTVAREARTIEGRLSKGDWIVGDSPSAADLAIYPCIRLLHRALLRPGAQELATRFLPAEVHYPQLARWLQRVEALPGYERTLPPGWQQVWCQFELNPEGLARIMSHKVYVDFPGRIVMVGFGSIGQGVLPLILRHIGVAARAHRDRHRR